MNRTNRRILRASAQALVAALLALLVAAGGVASAPASAHAADVVSRVVAVSDGDTVRIDPPINGLDELRLAGIDAVKPPLGRPANRPWPLADQAREALAALSLDKPIRLAFAGRKVDRYRRLVDQVYGLDGRWLQGALLEAGLARVHTSIDSREMAAQMLSLEAEARAARRGLWASPVYAVVSPAEARDRIATFAVVEGKVLGAREVKKRIYLNFGFDWRDDFTVTIDARSLALFNEAGLDPLALAGRTIRVRGWVEKFNGPSIEVTHPEQIELIAESD